MIEVMKSPTADSRSCDYRNVTKERLKNSTIDHCIDVRNGIAFVCDLLQHRADTHDADKLSDLDGFHKEFITGFETKEWLNNHYRVNRHHITTEGGQPENVNLIDVIEMLVDCVVAGMARTGAVYPIHIPPVIMEIAVANTVKLLTDNVVVRENALDSQNSST